MADLQSVGAMSDRKHPTVGISVHGPGASIDSAIAAGGAMKRLLDTVGAEMGIPADAVKWEIDSVQFRCDGCGLLRPDKPGVDEGWTYRDGDDFCPDCTQSRKDA